MKDRLAWLFERLLADPAQYDAFVVFDADSRPAPDFLKQVTQKLADGARVVQGRHVIANPHSSAFSAIADADMRLNNRIRNQAKENLGLSARLWRRWSRSCAPGPTASPWISARQPNIGRCSTRYCSCSRSGRISTWP